ncbi:MAG: TerB N-terminal domain-containing protein [Clostridia bacterium]|nr:TerB N-terminal domain-containing protein [Clostridia bacterium]
MMKGKDGFDENDSFWSLDSMLPPKSKGADSAPTAKNTDVSVAEIDIPGELKPKGEPIPTMKYPPITSAPKKALSFDAWLSQRREVEKTRYTAGKELLLSYEPENPLIKSVRISADKNRRPTSERFITDGMRYARAEGSFEENVTFDSIYPQYAGLTEKQRQCFIGFRTEVKNGRFPQIDRAYIYLLLYEIINLTEIYSPAERADLISSLIAGYPKCEERLFADMCNWLCDVCLIYRLPVPERIYGDCDQRGLIMASVNEFYMHRPVSVA